MNGNLKTVLMVVAALALGAGSMWVFLGGGADDAKAPGKTLVSRKVKAKKPAAAKTGSLRKKKGATATKVAISNQKRLKPTFALGDDEEKKLTEDQRRMIEEIRAALAADNFRALMRLVRQMQASNEWPDGIPKAVKLAAVDALGWFGGNCLPELVGFLADADSEVTEAASEAWEDAIMDYDSDKDISKYVVKLACKVVTNADSMESILSTINDDTMRPSVGVDTIKYVLANGNETAKAQLQEVIDTFTGTTGITTEKQLDEWLEEHPDPSDAEEMYGKMSDDDD